MTITVDEFTPSVEILGTDNISNTDDKLRVIVTEAADYLKNQTQNTATQLETQIGELASVGDETYTKEALDSKFATKVATSSIVNDLTTGGSNVPLSAAQGVVLKGLINSINTLLQSNDTDLDTLQELVTYIKANKDTLDTLGISNIIGLQNALNAKLPVIRAGGSNFTAKIESDESFRIGVYDSTFGWRKALQLIDSGMLYRNSTGAQKTVILQDSAQALHATDALRISGTRLYLYKGNNTYESVPLPSNERIYTAGSYIEVECTSISTTATSYTKLYEVFFPCSGVISTFFTLANYNSHSYAWIYKNGVAVGTERRVAAGASGNFSENITVNAGDKIQLYVYATNTSSDIKSAIVRNFRIMTGNPIRIVSVRV